MKSHKYIILSILTILLVMTLFFVLRPYVYKVIPPKQVEINKEFSIKKWQKVKFGEDKYVTYCGTQGNAVAGTGPYPAYKLDIKGNQFLCTHKAMDYDMLHYGVTRPYSVEFLKQGNPAVAIIKDSDDYYQEWGISRLECDTKDSSSQQMQRCMKENLFYIGDPGVCGRQSLVDKKTCEDYYVKGFEEFCNTYPSEEVGDDSWAPSDVRSKNGCLGRLIADRHLPSESCALLIDDKKKASQCFEDRKTEEDYFESLRN